MTTKPTTDEKTTGRKRKPGAAGESLRHLAGERVDLPDGYETTHGPADWYHRTCRRILADAAVRLSRQPVDPGSFSERSRFIIAASRWRRTLRAIIEHDPDLAPIAAKMMTCTPPGYVQHDRTTMRRCEVVQFCPFCYARGVGERVGDLIRCFYRRPDLDRSAWLIRIPVRPGVSPTGRSTGPVANPYRLLREYGCAGGALVRVPVSRDGTGVLIGISGNRVTGAVELTRRNGPALLADAVVRYMAWPWRRGHRVRYLIRDAGGNYGGRWFESYGLARKSGSGYGRAALRYADPAGT